MVNTEPEQIWFETKELTYSFYYYYLKLQPLKKTVSPPNGAPENDKNVNPADSAVAETYNNLSDNSDSFAVSVSLLPLICILERPTKHE